VCPIVGGRKRSSSWRETPHHPESAGNWSTDRLLLAVEIVSPSSARHDRVRKRPHYQRHRVSEYWIIDDASQTVERWTPRDERPELIAERLPWDSGGAAEPFVLDLVQFFRDAAPEDEKPKQ